MSSKKGRPVMALCYGGFLFVREPDDGSGEPAWVVLDMQGQRLGGVYRLGSRWMASGTGREFSTRQEAAQALKEKP